MAEEKKEAAVASEGPAEESSTSLDVPLEEPTQGTGADREATAAEAEEQDAPEEREDSQERGDEEASAEDCSAAEAESGSDPDGDSIEPRDSSRDSSSESKRVQRATVAEDEQEVHEFGDHSPRSPDGGSEAEAEPDTEVDTDVGEGESDSEYATEGVPRVCSYARALDLSEARLIRVPVDILEYSSLVQLLLEKNLLSSIQPELLALRSLKVLSLASNRISALPDGLKKAWPHLVQLDLSNNSFEEFPEPVTKLSGLISLKFMHNAVKVRLGSILAQPPHPSSFTLAGSAIHTYCTLLC